MHVHVDVCCVCGRGSYKVIEDNRKHVLMYTHTPSHTQALANNATPDKVTLTPTLRSVTHLYCQLC